ncbi:hypothetical protein NKR19_g6171 [Coniochaeta hoffmannii]|uniref:Sodium bile acid symporter family protein n=1 Tax=Coniochaeta hoffmannii TaxID=91930 RepID=A0AA38RSP3_9PEZI|nr:hypothetical protein NKR19_g6171 [Coniochaeta hoffmannii]
MIVGVLLGYFVDEAFLPVKEEIRVGLILVGLGRCIAMVLIWTGLAGGDNEYCAILVAVNSILQMVLFAPLAVFFIRVISGESGVQDVSYEVVATSVGVFLSPSAPPSSAVLASAGSLVPQGHAVVHQIVSVLRVAAPLLVYFVLIFSVTLYVVYRLGMGYALAATQSFTAASNNFELAIAVAVATLVYAMRWAGNRWAWKN